MQRINYQHLFYFWHVAKEQSFSRAAEILHLAQPTISGQLNVFEKAIGEKLFEKHGRQLLLTDTGRIVFHYAEEIFSLGRELTHVLNGRPGSRNLRLVVGVADVLPKLVISQLLEPAFRMPETLHLSCYEDKAERLFNDMTLQGIDLIISDCPLTPTSDSHVFNHLLGECSVMVFGTVELAAIYQPGFPNSLNNAPFILPSSNTAARRSLDQWFDAMSISPKIIAEIEDSALIKSLASEGIGLFIAPNTLEKEICKQYAVNAIGSIETVKERFYAVTHKRKLKHPAVTAILENARQVVFPATDLA